MKKVFYSLAALMLMLSFLVPSVALAHSIGTTSSISLSSSEVTEGTLVTVTGNVDPWATVATDHKGGKIQIQKWDGAAWVNLNGAGDTPDGSGNVSVDFDTTGLGGTTVNFRSHFVTGGGANKLSESTSDEGTLTINEGEAEPGENSAPELTVDDDPVTVDEGDTATNSGTYSDPDEDAVTLTASVGTITDNGDGTWDWSFATTDDSDSQTVTITADDGTTTTDVTFELVVNDVLPTIDSVTNDGPITVGGDATITVDASGASVDVLTYEFDCDNDSTYEVGPQSGDSAACTFTSVGSKTVNVRVTDDDGNAVTDSTVVSVVYDFGGFRQPIPPPISTFKAGSTIPVKFQLLDNDGNPVGGATATAYLLTTSASAVCNYDPIAQQYVCTLKTPKGISGSYTIEVTLDDGTSHTVVVTMKL